MPKTSSGDAPSGVERRKHRRYELEYPVDVKCFVGNSISELQAISKNVSLGGLLLEAASTIPQDCSVAFRMRVEGHPTLRPIQLVGEGKVARVEPTAKAGFNIAVKCVRPIAEMEKYFVGSAD